jgi:hypothetical protein
MYSSRGRRRSVACCEGHGQAYLLPRPGCHMNMRHDMRGQDQPYRYSARRQESNMHGLKPELYKYSVQMQSRRAGRRLGLALGPAGTSPSFCLSDFRVGFGVAALRSPHHRHTSGDSQVAVARPICKRGFIFLHTPLCLSSVSSLLGGLACVWGLLRANKKNKIHTCGYISLAWLVVARWRS